jgi:hypothetical protein
MKECFPENSGIFRQDEAPCHTAKAVIIISAVTISKCWSCQETAQLWIKLENIWKEMKGRVSRTYSTTNQ